MIEERSDGHVRWITLDKPDRLNSFTGADYRDLRSALERARVDDETRVVVVTGNGRAFSAGADLGLVQGTATEDERRGVGTEFRAMLEELALFDKPLLAGVNGYAIGVGCTMLLYFDLIIAAESARFRLPFTSLGILPEAGSSVLLPARVRWSDAMWAMLSSEWIDSAAAVTMGLAWRVVPDDELLGHCEQVASTLAALPPAAVTATKRLLIEGRGDAARAAIDREFAAIARLPGRTGPEPAP